ncbi:hypothetical protein ABPG72_000415 [Tetrahymena utriculariae]
MTQQNILICLNQNSKWIKLILINFIIYFQKTLCNIALLKNQLISIFKSNNKVGEISIYSLAQVLIQLSNLSDLSLSLKSNGIKNKGITQFSSQLPQFANLTSLKLDQWYNKFDAIRAQALGKQLEKCSNISTLILKLQGCKNEVGNVSLSTSFIRLQNFLLFNITIFPILISFNREIQYIIDSSIYIHTKKQEKSEQIIKNAIKALHEIWDSISDEIVSNTIDQINVNLREVSANNGEIFIEYSKIGNHGPFDVLSSTLAICQNLRIMKLGFGENNIEGEQEQLLKRKIVEIKQIVQFLLKLYDYFGEVSDSEEEIDEESFYRDNCEGTNL